MRDYPIVKIDRMTAQELLPLLHQKGLFSKASDLPHREHLLEEEAQKRCVEKLDKEAEREFLGNVGLYRTDSYVVRDFGDYTIAFNATAYINSVTNTEWSFDSTSMDIVQKGLSKIHLSTMSHKVAMLILSEAASQQKFTDVFISKANILNYLGYTSEDSSVYRDVKEILYSFKFLDYKLYKYKTNNPESGNTVMTGNFIYNIDFSDPKGYKISINPYFVGCVAKVYEGLQDKSAFQRGYFNYPTSLLPLTRNFSPTAYRLADFLIREAGNAMLNTDTQKIVAYSVPKLFEAAGISHSRVQRRVSALLDALSEVSFIESVKPSVEDLKSMKPRLVERQVLHISIAKSVEILNNSIKTDLLGAKSPDS